ncbi:LOW QUALITY PROTEIN: saccharopine dehydrogenase b [Osmerus mordax]|uniref:LOW QUALITY PROTEIN: saccharopine dehydrogenase b n=1 Tax=Osmerus mordax TaxID=8014 RepID=UPI00350F9911
MAPVTSTTRPYHVIIFGASGFTGQFVVEELARCTAEGPSGHLTWALAGRSRPRLEKVLNQAAETLSQPDLRTDVEIIVADVTEAESLAIMCKQAVVVLNCVGPFLERMQLDYHSKAVEAGLYVVGSCGVDSIPADMGILYTRDQFKGTLTAVESFLTIHTGPEGGCIHDGTWQSAVYGFADRAYLKTLRRRFVHQPLPVVGARVKNRGSLFFSKEVEQYAVPFLGSDASVVRRSQRFLYEEHQQSPVQYSAYVGIGGIGSVVKMFCGGLLFWLMVKFGLGRKVLITFPGFFSFGLFTSAGPTKKQMEGTSFSLTFYGEGYGDGLEPSLGQPNAKIITQVKGAEPGYVATPVAMVQAAITLLNEPQSLPMGGGVYSPGAAFAKTTLIDRLNRHGLKFSVKTG